MAVAGSLSRIIVLLLTLTGCYVSLTAPEVGIGRAARLLDQGNVREARTEIARAIGRNPLDPERYLTAIDLCAAGELWGDLVRMAEDLLARNASRRLARRLSRHELAGVHRIAGIAYWQMGRIREAESRLRKARSLLPDDPGLMNDLGYLYADKGIKLDEALRLTKRAAALVPDDGMIADSLGWAQYKLKEYASSARTLEKAVELAPDSADLRYHLGAVYVMLGRKMEAWVELRKALLLDRQHPEAAKLLKTLQI